ncbi:MAG: hypothetical protein KKF48_05710 [Nanoarchaeota archaeon]|nr:hypothetical protein [Nanoarchaeota archaeon]
MSPFKSSAQRRYMYARHPKIARRWSKESGEWVNTSKTPRYNIDGYSRTRRKKLLKRRKIKDRKKTHVEYRYYRDQYGQLRSERKVY